MLGNDGAIYFGSYDQKVYALNSDGSKRWEFATDGAVFASPALGSDGTLYCASLDGKLYMLNPDGTKRSEVLTNGGIESSPAVSPDGFIYFGSYDNQFYAVAGSGPLSDGAWPMFRRDLRHTARAEAGQITRPVFRTPTVGSSAVEIELTARGEAATNYAISASTNLLDWIVLTNASTSSGTLRIRDAAGAKLQKRFYRAASP